MSKQPTEYFTVLFKGDVHRLNPGPLKLKSPFGEAVASADFDMFERERNERTRADAAEAEIARLKDKAELFDLHFHDLRGTAVTWLSEAGCTHQEIATITGHSLKGVDMILDAYLARTPELAENAVAKLEISLQTPRK